MMNRSCGPAAHHLRLEAAHAIAGAAVATDLFVHVLDKFVSTSQGPMCVGGRDEGGSDCARVSELSRKMGGFFKRTERHIRSVYRIIKLSKSANRRLLCISSHMT